MTTRVLTPPTRVRFTRADYHRMGETGILPPTPRVELLDGEIIRMSPIGSRHGSVVDRLNQFFARRVGDRAIVRVQGAIVLNDHSEPEPDLALLRPRDDDYASAHPTPPDILLIIEVAESSVDYDLDAKLRQYALAEISEYWVFDLNRKVVIVHRNPVGDSYADVREYGERDRIRPMAFPDLELDLGMIFRF